MINVWKASTVALAVALVGVVSVGKIQTASAEDQPKMETALERLKQAKWHLDHAADDKGGHRVKAIAAAQTAIDETNAGIAFANKH